MVSLSWVEAAARQFEPGRSEFATPGELGAVLDPRTVRTPALDLIDQELVRVAETPESRLAISIAPQEGKTTRTVRDFIPWYLKRDPDARIVLGSYNQSIAKRSGRMVRNTIEWNPWLGLAVAADNGAKGEWSIAGHEGGMLSVGRGEGVSGRPADLVIIDDPFKEGEAQSEVIREAAWDWWTEGIAARFGATTRVVVIHCMTGDTPVLIPDGTERLLCDIRPGDEVATYEGGRLAKAIVKNWANQGPDDILSIRMRSGRVVRANAQHPFLTIDENGHEAWLRTDQIRPGTSILTAIGESGAESHARPTGANCPRGARECATRTTIRPAGQQDIDHPRSTQSHVVEHTSSIATASPTKRSTSSSPNRAATVPSVDSHPPTPTREPTGMASSASIMTTTQARSAACSAMTATSRSDTARQPKYSGRPLSTWSVTPDEVVSVEPCGRDDVYDLQIDRTENFIANGLVSHNTRWHQEDLIGQLLVKDAHAGWRYVNIPAQADHDPNKGETDPLGREPGEFMLSARGRTRRQWEQRKLTAGSRVWNALYQGRPSPAEGGVFKRDWWGEYDVPLWITDGTICRAVGFDAVLASWDMAFKDTSASDYVVGQVWAQKGADVYLLDQVRGRWDFPETLRQVRQLAVKWPDALLKVVEDKANGTAVLAQLRHTVPGLVAETPTESKEARAQAVAPLVEAKNVHLPSPELAPWVGDFIDECAAFNNGAHDDQVDAMSQALKRMVIISLFGDDTDDDDEPAYTDLSPW